MFAILAAAAMFAPVPEPDPAEQKALAALEALGFRFVLTDDKSKHVKELHYSGVTLDGKQLAEPTDKDLANIASLPNLVKLHLPPKFTKDATLDSVRSPILQELSLQGSSVTDDGLKKLAGLKKLTRLYLDSTEITDHGLKTLASFPSLLSVGLQRTHVTDKGLKELEKSKIGSLGLARTRVGDAGIPSLGKMPALGVLDLGMTAITDKGLAQMATADAFRKLGTLALEDTGVSDEGLKALNDPKTLPSLKRLGLERTHVTEEGIEALRKARPQLKVIWKR